MTGKVSILIIDDEKDHAEAAAESLRKVGYRCDVAFSGQDGLRKLSDDQFDIVFTDLMMHGMDGLTVLKEAKKKNPDIQVVMMTGYPSVETAVEAMQFGALTYLQKPVNIKELRAIARKAAEKLQLIRDNVVLRRQIDEKFGFEGIIGNSQPMRQAFEIVKQVVDTNATVLIQGESGVGKELFARAVHFNSSRKNNHFVALNCAALSEGILESELFGHEKGAFTGAIAQRKGRFVFAHLGTLFLDEIGDMPVSTQIKLLRVIENGEIFRVGSNHPIKIDVRLIAATNQDLEALVTKGQFREELYYRIKVVTINLPPLRERMMDIPLLVESFMKEFNRAHHKNISSVSSEVMNVLTRYYWPGNVRELKNCVESMLVTAQGSQIEKSDIPEYIFKPRAETRLNKLLPAGIPLEQAEKELIRNTLGLVQGNRAAAAKMLGISERTLYRKIKRFKL
ncbi:MAG: sigma-54-dependent Fis family transcriptional regulator [Planctomycetes bacterium]|nr:sigma-54-dependent Fis family transcriptional regulator [Planctomycetota bacterium]